MTDLSKSERDAFQSKAAAGAKAFAGSGPPATYVDPDPASTVNPHPELDAVEQLVEKAAPGAFGGAYEDEKGVLHVGLTGAAGLTASALATALPNVGLVVFNARHSWSKLLATTDEITELMASQPALLILSAGPDVKQNIVTVGVYRCRLPNRQSARCAVRRPCLDLPRRPARASRRSLWPQAAIVFATPSSAD